MSDYDQIIYEQLGALTEAEGYWGEAAAAEASAALQAAGIRKEAADKAAGVMQVAYDKGVDYQKQMWNEAKSISKPWIESGQWANTQLQKMMKGFDGSPEGYVKSPYFDWIQEQTIKGLDHSASSRGDLESGSQQKAVMEYSKNLATTDYDNYLNRYYDSLKPYQQMSQEGRITAGTLSNLGQSNANAVANLYASQGKTTSDLAMAGEDALASGEEKAGEAKANYLNLMGEGALEVGDIRASGYAQEANQDNIRTNSLYTLGGMVLPSVIESGYDAYKNYTPSAPDPIVTTPEFTSVGESNPGELRY